MGICTSSSYHLVQKILDTGDIAITTARKPRTPSFERTTLQNYQTIKLDITNPNDNQSTFVTALDRLGRIDMMISNIENNGHN